MKLSIEKHITPHELTSAFGDPIARALNEATAELALRLLEELERTGPAIVWPPSTYLADEIAPYGGKLLRRVVSVTPLEDLK